MRENMLADRESSVLSAEVTDREGVSEGHSENVPGIIPGPEIVECSALPEPSRQTPRVVVYSSDEAVPSQKFVAYITIPTRAPKTGVLSERRLGISFPASDGETARSAAAAWWKGELDRERARLEAAVERGRKLAAAREAKPAQIEVAAS